MSIPFNFFSPTLAENSSTTFKPSSTYKLTVVSESFQKFESTFVKIKTTTGLPGYGLKATGERNTTSSAKSSFKIFISRCVEHFVPTCNRFFCCFNGHVCVLILFMHTIQNKLLSKLLFLIKYLNY